MVTETTPAVAPKANLIAEHAHILRGASYTQFHQWLWRDRQPSTPFPNPADTQGTVEAEINFGRWIIQCPHTWQEQVTEHLGTPDEFTHTVTRQCPQAVIASLSDLWFLCSVCGSPDNNGKPYAVVFPPNRIGIENVLKFRPVDRAMPQSFPWESKIRNWKPGETIGNLQAENAARGLPTTGTPPEQAPI